MTHFNKEVSNEKKIESPVFIELIYNPKINIHIDKENGFFLKAIDSSYAESIQEKIVTRLEDVNIIVTKEKADISLSIENIILTEKNVEGTDSDNEDTIEVDVNLYINGYLINKASNQQKLIETHINSTTTTGMSIFSVLFKDSVFDTQKNDTYVEGIVEDNLISLFAKKCSENIF